MAVMKKQVAGFALRHIMAPLARLVYLKYRPVVIAITGSVGKTTTTAAVYEVLKPYFNLERSIGSANTGWSIVATLLNPGYQPYTYNVKKARGIMGPHHVLWALLVGIVRFFLPLKYPRILVLELGIDGPGDMAFFNSIIKYDVAIVTRVGQAHLEFFKDYEHLLKEKTLIFNGIKPMGLAITTADQADLAQIADKLVVRHELISETGEGSVRVIKNNKVGERFDVTFKFADSDITINLPFGLHWHSAAAFAIAVGREFALTPEQIQAALNNLQPVHRRLNVHNLSRGVVLVDDSYNANLESMKLAFEAIKPLVSNELIMVLGDMKELGQVSEASHLEVGRLAASQAKYLFTVGAGGMQIAAGAKEAGMDESRIYSVGDLMNPTEVTSMASAILAKIGDNDAVLIKASRAMALERVSKDIISKLS